jgi:Na+-translocating ferredoxin:NAD+ oxidoreductase subunit B
VTGLALSFAAVLLGLVGLFALAREDTRRRAREAERLEVQVHALLPQTQCGHCGYAGCRPYAKALVDGAPATLCAPGGQEGADELARVLGRPFAPLEAPTPSPLVAVIREEECIGCTKCIQACPVDAILGAAQRMHSVVEPWCTGCDLCVDPCPVDCIDLIPRSAAP